TASAPRPTDHARNARLFTNAAHAVQLHPGGRAMTAVHPGSVPSHSFSRRALPRGLRLPLVLILIWEAWFVVSDSAGTSLASPSQIASAFLTLWMDGSMLTATLQTLAATLMGLAIGGALGIVGGLFLGLSRSFDR